MGGRIHSVSGDTTNTVQTAGAPVGGGMEQIIWGYCSSYMSVGVEDTGFRIVCVLSGRVNSFLQSLTSGNIIFPLCSSISSNTL